MANKSKLLRAADQRPSDGRSAQPAVDRPQEPAPHILPSRTQRRPEMIRNRRKERRQAYERERRHWLLMRIGLGAVTVLIVAAVGYALFASTQRNQVPNATREFAVEAGHTAETVAYNPLPPVGGEHDPTPQTCGFYASPVRNENAVHSLEHGAIWITYWPGLPSDQVDRLRSLANDELKVLVSPFADLPTPVVVSSCGRQLWLDSAEDDRLGQFVQRFRGAAPEPGAACFGVGTPA